MAKTLAGQSRMRAQRYAIALACGQVPYDIAVLLVASWLKKQGHRITAENLEVAFDVEA